MKQTKSIAAKNILSKASVASLVSGHTTLLQATLWGRNVAARENSTDDPYSPSPAAQMLSDLVLASDGELLSCSDSGISASYKSARQAITAVRHMQQLVKGFSEVAAAGPLYSSFTLQFADQAADSSDADLSLVPSSRSESEAVFLIGDICADAKSIPGLRFKESISTTQKKRGKVLELLPSTRAPQSEEVAPRIEIVPAVKEPSPITRSRPPVAQRPIPPAIRPKPTIPAKAPPPPTSAATTPAILARAKTMLADVFRSRQVVGSIIAVVIIAVGATAMHFARSKSESNVQPPPSATQPPNPTPPPTLVSPPIAKTAPVAPVAAPPVSATEPPSSHPGPSPKPAIAPPPKPRPTAKDRVPDEPEVASSRYTKPEIEQMITRADKLSGDGNYDKAITLYNLVLRQDGRNPDALAGRDRAIRNKRHQ